MNRDYGRPGLNQKGGGGGGGGGGEGVKMTDKKKKSHCTDLDFCWFLFVIDQTGHCTDLGGFCFLFLFFHSFSSSPFLIDQLGWLHVQDFQVKCWEIVFQKRSPYKVKKKQEKKKREFSERTKNVL